MDLGSARERIERQIAASAVWLELDRDCGTQMDEVLGCIDTNVADGRFAAVVSTTPELIDAVTARSAISASKSSSAPTKRSALRHSRSRPHRRDLAWRLPILHLTTAPNASGSSATR
jgi:hypothetical protein